MSATVRPELAERLISMLRDHERDLREAGLRRLSVFGSVARGDHEDDSDVDLAAELDLERKLDLVDIVRIERRLTTLLGRSVHLTTEPIGKPRLHANVERHRLRVF